MKLEYDFSKGERGKYFRPGSEIHLPIYRDTGVQAYLAECAARKGVPLGDLVNGLRTEQPPQAHRGLWMRHHAGSAVDRS